MGSIIGIDPGITGYIVVLREDGKLVDYFHMPVITTVKKIKKRNTGKIKTSTKTILDIHSLARILQANSESDSFCVVERQHPIPGQGLSSTSKTMFGFGAILGVIEGLGLKYQVIGAKEWQKGMLDQEIEDTKVASIEAVKHWNKDIDLRRTKKSKKDDHNLADALNISRWGFNIKENSRGNNGE